MKYVPCTLYYNFMYSKVSIKRPVLLNDLVHLKKIDRTVLFKGCHSQFFISIKRPGLDFSKKSLFKRPGPSQKKIIVLVYLCTSLLLDVLVWIFGKNLYYYLLFNP